MVRVTVRRLIVYLLILAGFSGLPAMGVQPPGDDALGDSLKRPLRFYDDLHHTPGTQRLLNERSQPLNELRDWLGVDAWALWNEDSRTARTVLVGGGIVQNRIVADAELQGLAESVVATAGPLLGVDPATLVPVRTRFINSLRVVQFEQRLNGVRVYPSFVLVTFFQRTAAAGLRDELVLTRLDAEVAPNAIDKTPTISSSEATAIARRVVGRLRATGTSTPTLEVAPARPQIGKGVEGRLVYRLNVSATAPLARYEIRVDAHSGDVVSSEDRIRYLDVTGNVSGWATPGQLPDLASNPPTLQPLEGMTVSVPGVGSAVTDANGDFVIPHSGTSNVTANLQLVGPWVNVNHVTGPDVTESVTFTPGTPATIVFNANPTALVTAQVNGLIQTNRVHDYIKGIDPAWNDLDVSFPCNTNINDNCNAYYDGSSINFFTAGGGCANSCYSNVVYHEYGHAVIDNQIPFAAGHYHEGVADVLATYLANNPTVGAMFSGNSFIRDVDIQDREYPQDLGNPIHDAGLIVGGAFWDTLQAMITSLGQAPALTICAEYYLHHMAFQTGTISPVLTIDVLTVDDDDGNILNGTPHYAEINQGFSEHGLDAPALDFLSFTFTPLADAVDDTIPVPVSVIVLPNIAASVNTVEVLYREPSGSYTTVAMTAGANPDEYTGQIPAIASPTRIEYFIRATDSDGNEETLPEGGSTAPFSYFVGMVDVFFNEPVGNNDAGWIHVDALPTGGQDDWHRGPPNQRQPGYVNQWDPLTAFSGNNIWGNDLALVPNWNGNYRSNVNNYLESPPIDCSQHTGIWLQFRRWLTVESSQWDFAQLRVNGSVVYTNPFNVDQVDSEWVLVSYDISALADNNPAVRLRFGMDSDGAVTFGGWNIDNIQLISVTDANPTIFSLTAPATDVPLGTTTNVPLLLQNDEPVTGYSAAGTFDPTLLSVTGMTVTGTDLGALNPAIFVPQIGSDYFSAEASIDLTFTQVLPAGVDQSVVHLEVQPTAAAMAGGTTQITLDNGVGPTQANNTITLQGGNFEFLTLTSETLTFTVGTGPTFLRGDCDGDGSLAIPDAVLALSYLFNSGVLNCLDAADVNDDSSVNLQDPVLLLGYLFNMGIPPAQPFPTPGTDPTPDALGCP